VVCGLLIGTKIGDLAGPWTV